MDYMQSRGCITMFFFVLFTTLAWVGVISMRIIMMLLKQEMSKWTGECEKGNPSLIFTLWNHTRKRYIYKAAKSHFLNSIQWIHTVSRHSFYVFTPFGQIRLPSMGTHYTMTKDWMTHVCVSKLQASIELPPLALIFRHRNHPQQCLSHKKIDQENGEWEKKSCVPLRMRHRID